MNKEKIDRVREYFVNPEDPTSAGDLAELGSKAIEVMAQIYASGGDVSLMSKDCINWLNESNNLDSVESVLRDMLNKETGTRVFDEKFMGQIHPQGNKIGILANLIAAYMNTNTVVKEVSISEHAMELEVTEWLEMMFGYDAEIASGNIVTDGTTANIAALWVARELKKKQIRENQHWYDIREPLIVLTNSLRHYSIDKAAEILGVQVVPLPTSGFKTDISKLDQIISAMNQRERQKVMAIVGVAGETETGLIDDIEGLVDIKNRYGLYLHVDAAYGGPYILSEVGSRFSGISQSDSITVDPHKMLYTPYTAGAILFRDRANHALIQKGARYLDPTNKSGLFGDFSKRNFGFSARVEGSMGSGGVMAAWSTIRLLGEDGIETILNHTLELADKAFEEVSKSDYLHAVHKPEINTMLFGINHDLFTDIDSHNQALCTIQKKLDEEYGYYVSVNDEVDGGRMAFRFVAMHPWTDVDDVTNLFGLIDELVDYELESRV